MTLSKFQPVQLKRLIIEVIKSNPAWRVVSTTATLIRAIPKQLEDVLPPIGSSANAPSSAWLTLDFWIDNRPKPRLGVFWRSNPVRDREARNRVLKALVESRGTGFVYQGTKGPWSEIDIPFFSGKTVSDSTWWASGEEPDLEAARDVIRCQIGTWNDRLPRIAEMVSTVPGPTPTNGRSPLRDSAETVHRLADRNGIDQLASNRKPPRGSILASHLAQFETKGVLMSKIKLTPPLPEWVREDRFQLHYTNIHELLKSPRLTSEQRAENTRRLYGTETLEGFNDWNASVLLLAKDAGKMETFRRLIEDGDGIHCQENPCTQPWRHAVPPESGSGTNTNLRRLAEGLPGTKLYGSVMAGLLRNDGEQGGQLPNFNSPELQMYLRRILDEIVFPNMDNLRVVICLGDEACKVVGTVIRSKELTRNFRTLRNAAEPIPYGDKRVFASYHTSARVMNNPHLVEKARRVWSAAKRVLED